MVGARISLRAGQAVVRVWSLAFEQSVGVIDNLGGGGYALANSREEEEDEDDDDANEHEGSLLGVVCHDARLRIFCETKHAVKFQQRVEKRETSFLDRGGEVWAVNLRSYKARMLLPRVQVSLMACGKHHGLLLDSQGVVQTLHNPIPPLRRVDFWIGLVKSRLLYSPNTTSADRRESSENV